MAWWDWPRWELELDFMALSGVNLPLLFVGFEHILARVFGVASGASLPPPPWGFALSETELAPYFSGLAFLPWQRMGNEAGWGGPLGPAVREAQWALQLKIVARARAGDTWGKHVSLSLKFDKSARAF